MARIIIIIIIIAFVIPLGILFTYIKSTPEQPKNIQPSQMLESPQTNLDETEKTMKIDNKQQQTSTPSLDDEFKRVASVYEQQIQYPDYSIPLKKGSYLLNPNQSQPVTRSYEQAGLNGSIALNLDHHRYEEGETANAFVVLKGDNSFFATIESIEGKVGEQQAIDFSLVDKNDNDKTYKGDFSTEGLSGEQRFHLNVDTYDDEPILQSIPFSVYSPIGKVVETEATRVANNELIIPVTIDVDKEGFYHLSANFIHQETQTPISHLQGDVYTTSKGENTIELKVHGKHFIDNDLEGDFFLDDIQLQRKPTKPGPDTHTQWGKRPDNTFPVKDIDKEQFRDQKATNSLNQARLDFLEKMGNND